MRSVGPVGSLVALGLLSLTTDAHAQSPPGPVDLAWSAPAECPSVSDVRAAVSRDLGATPQRGAPLVARATVARSNMGWTALLVVTGPDGTGERALHAATCGELADATALILALAIDPRAKAAPPTAASPAPPATTASAATPAPAPTDAASGEASGVTPAPTGPPKPPTAAPRAAPARDASVPRAGVARSENGNFRRDGFGVGLVGLGDLGTLPASTAGASVALLYRWRALRVALDGTWLAPAHGVSPVRASAGGDFTFLAAGGGACLLLDLGSRVDVGPCLGLEVDRLHAAGTGVTTPTTDAGSWVSAGGGAHAVVWLFRGLGVQADISVHAPLSRPSFVLEGLGSVHRPAVFAGRAAVGLEAVLF